MKARIKKAIPIYSMLILASFVVHSISTWLKSDYFEKFLEQDLVTILIALLAINLTTISVIMAKMQELAGKGKLDYSNVIEEMRISIKEQVALIIVASLLLIAKKSNLVALTFTDANKFIQILLITVFSCAIWILYSTGEGIFIIAKIENKRMLEKHEGDSSNNN